MLDGAVMITADTDRGTAIRFHADVRLEQPPGRVRSAVLRASAHGIYQATVNGRPVSEALFSPGWTSYEWRLQVQEYDVAGMLAEDNNLDVLLGNGWYRGDLGFGGADANYGDEIGFIGELVVRYADGAEQRVVTGTDWTAAASEHVANSIYQGQTIDARRRSRTPEALPVRVLDFDRSTLVAQVGPPVTRHEVLRPQRIWASPSGRTLVDFGQNLVGWVRMRAHGPAGTVVTVRHAEVLEHDELGTRPLRSAEATDRFILSGGDDEFEPTLTFHGFRYAEVSGFPGEPTPDDLEAVVVHSDLRPLGSFECSDPLVNRLVANSLWSQKGNFLDVPTDCPQRDERLGWTGDIAAYAATASYQFDTRDFLHKWLLDLAEEVRHSPHGWVPHVVPDVLKHSDHPQFRERAAEWDGPTTIWGDAAVWVPQALWQAYGDADRLAAHYPAMVRHLDGVLERLSPTGLWDTGFQFGDWLDPDAPPDRPADAKADVGVVATACLYRSLRFAAEAASVLGHHEDAGRWTGLADRTRGAFLENYVSDEGVVRSDCATVYALAIRFGLLDGVLRATAGERLARLVAERGYVVTTGFAGTPFVTWALSETGHVDAAYRLLLERSCPSWLYPVTMGATTIWERWDSMLPDGSINPGEMTSFNHYALGAVADWIYQVVGGIRPGAPGYAELLLQPTPGPGLDFARGTLDTPHGHVECGWRRDGDSVVVDVVVPEGVDADVVLPDGARHRVSGGAHRFTCAG
ncbi:MAG TPA: family 78 glycoside hydrolase catalytic domain [Propionibacteriaceae bacterium]|nr:family 78 glycoside hydrolase catalytic domain [Propionibacteriaceae bacterium]